MSLQKLFDGPSYLTTTKGSRIDFTRLITGHVGTVIRADVTCDFILNYRRFLLPWKKPVVTTEWDIAVSVRRKDGTVIRRTGRISLPFNQAVELMVLETVKEALLFEMRECDRRLAG